MKFYHGTNKHGLKEIKKQGYLLHKRVILDDDGKPLFNPSPCTYLAVDIKEAKQYGDIILEVEYDPYKTPEMNNYQKGAWQIRVYEPIHKYKLIERKTL